jgi:hypothetical protein
MEILRARRKPLPSERRAPTGCGKLAKTEGTASQDAERVRTGQESNNSGLTSACERAWAGRGPAIADLNNDGREDVAVLKASILRQHEAIICLVYFTFSMQSSHWRA